MNLWGVFGQDPKKLFLQFVPQNSHWRVVTWNFDLQDPTVRRWTIEVHGEKEKIIEWEEGKTSEIRFFENSRLIRKRRLPERKEEWRALMNIATHSTLKYGIESNHEFMLTPVSGATTLDMQSEARALQWIKASFGTLTRALQGVKDHPEHILTAACFSGKAPETGESVLRIVAFNLDIFYYMREDQTLHIVIFNDKDLGHGQSQTPSFQQIIKVTKPQFYDEITKLLHQLAQVGEIG